MNYLLALLSHGHPESPTAERCIDSFSEFVTPKPITGVYVHDGPGWAYAPIYALAQVEGAIANRVWSARAGGEQQGFCKATRDLWRLAVEQAPIFQAEFVFWLEHDFVFTRPVDLDDLAYVLKINKGIAQMALMRGPANAKEEAAGGLYQSQQGEFRHRITSRVFTGDDFDWLEHRSYFTTNPSLMRADFMRDHPWKYEEQCEGLFGIDLLADRNISCGVWGEGEPWIDHVGQRDGKGFGY